jgi:nucleotide-binding universal stress UspA family protein
MLDIQRLLVPTDFSLHSDQALDYAVDLARLVGAKEIRLLHMLEVPPTPVPIAGAIGADTLQMEQTIRDSAAKALQDRKARIESESGDFRVETLLMSGSPAGWIAQVAESQCADLIVMGSHGRHGLAHVLFGSIAERTMTRAPCPVLIVTGHEEGTDDEEAGRESA